MMTVKSAHSQPVLVECSGKNALLYHRKRDSDAVKEAEDCGYFITVDLEFIKEFLSCGEEKTSEKDIANVRFLAFSRMHVRNLDGLGACRNLTVLLLANNFISRIDALAPCSELLKLDLHGNQIAKLPDPTFWKGLRRLRILHLHDNPIGKYRTIDGMSCCQNLTLLTLCDTPISVRRHYRHHVVNTIWSLRALDSHVISDEEIIEGARFGGRFTAQSKVFQLPSSAFKEVAGQSAGEALASIWALAGRVNSILAHHSPVLIIQRHWRGFLTRSAIRWAIETELWAALTIQRRYREWKKAGRRGATTALLGGGRSSRRRPSWSMTTPGLLTDRCRCPRTPSLSAGRFDYESYLMSRRSVSSVFSRVSPMPGTRARPPSADVESVANLPNATISFDLLKLEMNIADQLARDGLEDDESPEESTKEGDTTDSKCHSRRSRLRAKSTSSLQPKPRKMKSVKEFFGPVVTPENPDDAGDSPLARFRLRGIREEVRVCDPRDEIAEEKQNCARFVRLSDDINHMAARAQPKPKVSCVPIAEVREREARKYRGAIWLACLYAVGKDYKRAEAAERAAQQAAYVRRLKETRDGARDRIRAQLADERRRSAIISHIEQEGLVEDLHDRQTKSAETALKYNVARRQSAQFERVRLYESEFASDFVGRTASCTKADFRFGAQEMRSQRARMKRELVTDLREQTADVRNLRQTLMVKRRNNVQHHGLAEKNELRKRISESVQERIEIAQNRVAELRRSKTDVGDRRSKPVLLLPIISDPRGNPIPRSHTCNEIGAR